MDKQDGFINIFCDERGGTAVRINMGTEDSSSRCQHSTCTCDENGPTGKPLTKPHRADKILCL